MKRLAIVGATGLVGNATLNCLQEEGLLDKFELFLFVSDRSAGKVLVFDERHYPLIKLGEDFVDYHLDYALFLTSEDVSEVWVKKFAKTGIKVIDNSSAFRLRRNVPLIVPEINIQRLKPSNNIIANPNCSTIQLVIVLDRLSKVSKLKRVIVSSYQSVSGAGRDALMDLMNDTMFYFEHGITNNIIAQIGDIQENGNTKEENKIINETKKILNSDIEIHATAVRVPIPFCHGESVFVEFENDINFNVIKSKLECEYIKYSDVPFYPSECVGSNLTYVCRLRETSENSIQFFVIADNLRRGAGFNAVKILEYLALK